MINIDKTLNTLSQIDPYLVLSDLNIPREEADKILDGDFSYLVKSPLPVMDFDVIMSVHGKHFNKDFIRMFLTKTKEKEQLSEEEIKLFDDILSNWFEMIFKKGSRLIWKIEESGLEDCTQCILLKDGEDYYILTFLINEKVYLLHYAGQIGPDLEKSDFSLLNLNE